MERSAFLFGIHPEVEAIIRDSNPWWRGDRDAGLPPLRRWAFDPVLRGLRGGLTPAVVLRGPRQIGKTTLLRQIIDHLLSEGLPPRHVFRVQFDDLPSLRRLGQQPILALCRWYADHVLGMSFQRAAAGGHASHDLPR
ncbi:MAG: AAA family ATPase [Rhodospirillaceae bacterium]|nr:AAA family ATPase [Rhodospirillaceae bacterium]